MSDQSLSLEQPQLTPATLSQAKSMRRSRRTWLKIIAHLGLIAGSVMMMMPLVWMLSTALKKTGQEWVFPPVWIPNPIWWRNYSEAMAVLPVPFYQYVLNTLIITLG